MAEQVNPQRDLEPGELCHSIAVCLSTESRGKITLQWNVTTRLADELISEFRDRFGEPSSESVSEDAGLIDELARRIMENPGHTFISRDG